MIAHLFISLTNKGSVNLNPDFRMDLTSRLKLPLHSLEQELSDLLYPGEVAGHAGVETRELSPATASAG